jgi:hypothetical protein
MASLQNVFIDQTAQPSKGGFEPLPAGSYIAMITDSEIKATKAGTGTILSLTHTVVDGPHANKKIFARLNVGNPNATAQKIGQEQFAAVRAATGVLQPRDTGELHGKPMKIKVKIRKDETYGDSNEITSWEPATGVSAPTAAPSAPWGGQQAPAPAAGATPPWQK